MFLFVCLAPAGSRAEPIPYPIRDGDFADSDWQATALTEDTQQSAERIETGGNPGAYRHMVQQLPPGKFVSILHLRLGEEAVYSPAERGAIAGITYSEDRKEFDPPVPGAAVGALFAIQQGEHTFFSATDMTFSNTEWESRKLACLKPEDFLMSDNQLPDFSASGEPIRFGILRTNTNSGGTTLDIVHGLDNFRVAVFPAPNPDCVTCAGYDDAMFCGEMNGDCKITASDALFILQIAVASRPWHPAGDLDFSGKVTSSDALKDLRVAVQIDSQSQACNG
jgi:hypothetical protein